MSARSRARFALFLGLAFGVSWACWTPAAVSGEDMHEARIRWLVYLGTLGPAIAAIALVHCGHDKAARARYWDRVLQAARLRPVWLLPVLALYPAATLVSLTVANAVAGEVPDLQLAQYLVEHPAAVPGFLLLALMLGPLPEELGWRGYALDWLQARCSALASSLILGVIWAGWHLPLFLVTGSYQNSLVVGWAGPAVYCVTIVILSVFFTWIYNNNDRSTFSAILFHLVLNVTGTLLPGSPLADACKALVLAAAACFVVARWKPGTLVRNPRTTILDCRT